MKDAIHSTFNAHGEIWEYEGWFEPNDNEGLDRLYAAFRHRRREATGLSDHAWSDISRVTLPKNHAHTLHMLAFNHFSDALGMLVVAEDFEPGLWPSQ